MSPSSREINGPRPAPLKIHKESHLINKQSSSSSSSSSSTATTTSSTTHHHRHHPIIIYTHSPKIIHTHARDFMALVQKLTGLSHSTDDDGGGGGGSTDINPPPPPSNIPACCKDADTMHAANDDSSSSSSSEVVHHMGCSSLPSATAAVSAPLGFDHQPAPPNPFLSEIPLLTPSPSEFFCPQRTFYRYPESALFSQPIPTVGGSISPSIMEVVMKAFPDH